MGQYRDYNPADDPQQEDGDPKFLGVNARLAPDKLAPGMVANAENVRMRNGEPETRLGVAKPAWMNVTAPGVDAIVRGVGQFYGVGAFQDPNGVEWVLIASDGGIYRHRQFSPRAQLGLPTGVKLLGRCVPVQAFNQVFLFRGINLQPLVCTDIDAGFTDLIPRYNSASAYAGFGTSPQGILEQASGIDASEVAFGPWQSATLTSASNTVTVTTPDEHGYVTGADVTVRGANQSEYNGRFNITVLDPVTFTYEFGGSGTTPATGTITCSNQAYYWQALGSVITLTSLTSALVGSVVIATATKASHGFSVGQYVNILGATSAGYNGTYQITGKPNANTFTFILPGGVAPTDATALGTITAQSSVTLAGQTPETNPEAWQRIWNVLPNSDDAEYVDNRLLVPTAYTPGDDTYDASSHYGKKDYIVFTDILDPLHFSFFNELRINEGSADEIVAVKKYNQDTVIVVKGASWGVLTGMTGDPIAPSLDMRGGDYGGCAPRSLVVAGINALFPSTKRGICSLQQNELGQTRSVDQPFSNDLDGVIQRINWSYGTGIRLAWWDDKLYCACPLDGASANNAMLVYDFRRDGTGSVLGLDLQAGQWDGYDTGAAINVVEFFEATHAGKKRLCYLGADGFVNLVEECWEGDQAPDASRPNGLGFVPVRTDVLTRGYTFNSSGQKQFTRLDLAIAVWNARFSVTKRTEAANTEAAVRTDVSFNRTQYLKPVGKTNYVEGNTNGDWATPGRGDYSVALLPGGIATGFALGQYQEVVVRPSVRTLSGRYAQFRVTSVLGRIRIASATPSASDGQRRNGILI